MKNIINMIFWHLQQLKSNLIVLQVISVFNNPEMLATFNRLNRLLTKATGTTLEPLFKLRLLELDQLIRRHKIRSICEMGSGRTTFFFNLFGDIDVVSYEQDEYWRSLLLSFHATYNLRQPKIVSSQVEHYREGGRFVSIDKRHFDMLYIDGPYFKDLSCDFLTFTGKPAYYDFENVLSVSLPKLIIVEGRTDTVDMILNSPFSKHYHFQGELTWALERSRYNHAMRLRRHSIFIAKTDE